MNIIVGNELLLQKPINMEDQYIGLSIVPVSLRCKLFVHYHSSLSGGHTGAYKNLLKLRMCFFWPLMRKSIKLWVSKCAYCVSYNVYRSKKSKIHVSWPITVPFWMMHVDLWTQGLTLDEDRFKGYLINCLFKTVYDLFTMYFHS